MNKPWLVAISFAPLLGASQTLLQAATLALLSVTAILVHRSCMTALRRWLEAGLAEVASVLIAAMVVTCQVLTLQAWALELRQALGIYPELIALQCVLLDYSLGKGGQWRRTALLLSGLCGAYLCLGASRELLASGTLHFSTLTGPDTTGLRLASLAPGALLLLGVLLAVTKRACPKQANPDREGNH